MRLLAVLHTAVQWQHKLQAAALSLLPLPLGQPPALGLLWVNQALNENLFGLHEEVRLQEYAM